MAATAAAVERLAAWQAECLTRIRTAGVWDSAPTDEEIGRVAGVSSAAVGKWRRGELTMAGYHLVALAEAFGAEVVLGGTTRQALGRPLESAVDLQSWLAGFVRTLVSFEADGLDAGEAAELRGMLVPATALIDRVRGQLDRIVRRRP